MDQIESIVASGSGVDESDSTHSSIVFEAELSFLDHSCTILEVTLLAWPTRLFNPPSREIPISFHHPLTAQASICITVVILPADVFYEVVYPPHSFLVQVRPHIALVRKHRGLPAPAISLLLLPVPLIVSALLNSHSSCRSEKGNDYSDHSGHLVV